MHRTRTILSLSPAYRQASPGSPWPCLTTFSRSNLKRPPPLVDPLSELLTLLCCIALNLQKIRARRCTCDQNKRGVGTLLLEGCGRLHWVCGHRVALLGGVLEPLCDSPRRAPTTMKRRAVSEGPAETWWALPMPSKKESNATFPDL